MFYIVLPVLAVILDRVSKYFAVLHLKDLGVTPFIKGLLNFRYTENTGAAFSILRDKTGFLAVLGAVVILFMCWFLRRSHQLNADKWLYLTSIAMIIGGAAGNFIDRVVLGYVIDFFDFAFVNFAIFNVADIFICVGAFFFCATLIFDKNIVL